MLEDTCKSESLDVPGSSDGTHVAARASSGTTDAAFCLLTKIENDGSCGVGLIRRD